MSRTENLRLKADYTGAEIDDGVAKEVVAHAEKFVRTVERVFGLEERSKDVDVKDVSGRLDRASQHDPSIDLAEPGGGVASRPSIEEQQRQAAENWRRKYYDKRDEIPGPEQKSADSEQNITENDNRRERDTGMDFDPEG